MLLILLIATQYSRTHAQNKCRVCVGISKLGRSEAGDVAIDLRLVGVVEQEGIRSLH